MPTSKQKAKELQKSMKKQIKETDSQIYHSEQEQEKAQLGITLIIFQNQKELMENQKLIMQSLDLLLGQI